MFNIPFYKINFILFCFTIILISCKKENTSTLNNRGKLETYQYITTISKNDVIHNFPEQADYAQQIDTIAKYAVKMYRYTYHSIYKNQPIILSGLIMIPEVNQPFPIFTYLHGTMKPYPLPEGEGNLDIPSIYHGEYPDASWKQGETRLFGSFTASHGYITILPDYAGYGASANVAHPYTIHRELAYESVDAILAAKEFLIKENIATNNKVFLAGWSEGAGASLATQKEIEKNHLNQINLMASGNFAGPYDMKANGELVVLLPLSFWEWDAHELDDNLWSLYATNYFAENPLPLNSIFKFNVASESSVMKDRISNKPTDLLQLSFVGNQFMKDEFKKNDLIMNWNPIRKAYFYYGTEDTNVFPFNNENAYNVFRNKGSDVELIKFVGDDHYTPVLKYYLDMIGRFDKL